MALRLARASGLTAPESCAAIRGGRRGIVVRSFVGKTESLSVGAEVVRGADENFSLTRKASHTVEGCLKALRQMEVAFVGSTLVAPFLEMLLFDAWIGNTDRHPENWGVIEHGTGERRFAPIYDPAGCLGAILLDTHPLVRTSRSETALQNYITKCRTAFGNGERMLSMPELVDQLRALPEWNAVVGKPIASFRAVYDNQLVRWLEEVPALWFPDERKSLAVDLLGRRLGILEKSA